MSVDSDIIRNELRGVVVSRIDVVVVNVNNVEFAFVSVISLMTVALMCVQIDYHELFDSIPFLKVMSNKSDVRIDAETAASATCCMVKSSSEVDCPSVSQSNASCVDTSLSRAFERLKTSPTKEPGRYW